MQNALPAHTPYSWLNRHLDDLTELLLLLPALLWTANWLILPVALPLCLGMAWMYIRHWRQRRTYFTKSPGTEPASRLSPPGIIICILIAAGITFLNGFDGRLPQTPDFIVRNAVYGELIHSPWPLILEDGSFVIYAIQYWIPPALLASCLPEWKTPILEAWFFTGLLVVWLQLLKLLGWKRLIIFTIGILVTAPPTFILKNEVSDLNILPPAIYDCTSIYHFYVLFMLAAALFLQHRTTYPELLFCAALLFVSAPLTAAFFAPLLLWRTIQHIKEAPPGTASSVLSMLKLPELTVGIVLVLCQIIFSSSATGAYISTSWAEMASDNPPEVIIYRTILSLLLTLTPPLLAFAITKEKLLIYTGIFCSACTLICITGEGQVNELLYKSSAAYCFFLIFYLARHCCNTAALANLALLASFSLPVFWHFLIDLKAIPRGLQSGFEVRQTNIVDPWQGRMYQPRENFYERLVSHDLKCPWLFRRSEDIRTTPGNAAPPAQQPTSHPSSPHTSEVPRP